MSKHVVAALAWIVGSGGAGIAVAEPEERGPMAIAEMSLPGAPVPTRVYHPDGPASPAPLVIVVHGFGRNGSYHAELGRTLASRGFVAAVPDMPCLLACDFSTNADHAVAVLDLVAALGEESTSPLFGRVDGELRGAVGHSWGSSVFVAASRDPRIRAVVGFDPVDQDGKVLDVLPALDAATLHLFAEGGGCGSGPWEAYNLEAAPPPRMGLSIAGAYHCDAEDPSDAICTSVCGTPAYDNARARLFRRYAVAWLACALHQDGSMQGWMDGPGSAADMAAGRIKGVTSMGLGNMPCATGGPGDPDAGAPGGDADGGPGGSDGGNGGGGGDDDDDGAGGEAAAGCGCRGGTGPGDRAAALALPLVLVLALLRRRAPTR
jgi:MYXO-CTERM domain-containing protein